LLRGWSRLQAVSFIRARNKEGDRDRGDDENFRRRCCRREGEEAEPPPPPPPPRALVGHRPPSPHQGMVRPGRTAGRPQSPERRGRAFPTPPAASSR
jgi:hypothetical protein